MLRVDPESQGKDDGALSAAANRSAVAVSVVIPVRNEGSGIDACHAELSRALSAGGYRYELIFIDDGSSDDSWQRLQSLQATCHRTTCIRLRRHAGQQQALLVGLRFARGAAVATYDADMQFSPEGVPRLARKIHEGYDIASGIRMPRWHTLWSNRLPSRIGNVLVNYVLQLEQQDFGAVKAYSRLLVREILDRSHRFSIIPALAYSLSDNFTELEVPYQPRRAGRSKWNLFGRVAVFLHIYADQARRPFAGLRTLGLALMLLGIATAGSMVLLPQVNSQPFGDWLLLGVAMVVVGSALCALALAGRFFVRVYRAAPQRRPEDLVETVLGRTPGLGSRLAGHGHGRRPSR